jgi:hypothetical protein
MNAARMLSLLALVLSCDAQAVRDGSSFEKAVILTASAHAIVAEEWHWIVTQYPGASILPCAQQAWRFYREDSFDSSVHVDCFSHVTTITQKTSMSGSNSQQGTETSARDACYEAITFARADGKPKTVYFDVTDAR